AILLEPFKSYQLKKSRFTFAKDSFIASGGFGSVHLAVMDKRLGRSGSGDRVAVKKLHFAGNDNFMSKANALAREISVWSPLDHPNILAFVGFCVDRKKKEAWLVSSFAENGVVLSFIRNQNLHMQGRLGLVKDTILALHYMHTRDPPICHGDIKPVRTFYDYGVYYVLMRAVQMNILVNSQGRAMLCDFGLANAVSIAATGYTTSGFKRAGTLRYQSPELLSPNAVRSVESDIWAWGCVVLELCTPHIPFQGVINDVAVVYQLLQCKEPADVRSVEAPSVVRDLLAMCWEIEPGDRATSKGCLERMEVEEASGLVTNSPEIDPERPERRLNDPEQRSPSPPGRSTSDTTPPSSDESSLELKLRGALLSVEHLYIKRSRLTLSQTDDEIVPGKSGGVHRATLDKFLAATSSSLVVAVKRLRPAIERVDCLRVAI
ncbi:hypothetical protein FRB99_002424, partial [Tulasnella sp. 403]